MATTYIHMSLRVSPQLYARIVAEAQKQNGSTARGNNRNAAIVEMLECVLDAREKTDKEKLK